MKGTAMFDIQRVEIEWAGRTLVLETGRLARQADGAVLATYGETSVLCTVVGATQEKPGIDFFPLTVNYQEKTFAAGKIPGGYFKREGRPTEKETLTSRLIDRPIRPLFAKGYKNETQVIATVLSHDLENDPDVVAMVAASAALTLSGVPFMGPIGAARGACAQGRHRRDLGPAHRRNVQEAREGDRPGRYPRQGHAHRRPRPEDGSQHRRRSRRPAAHPRLGAVHPRRDAGAVRGHPRH